jgi:hypothetical protein
LILGRASPFTRGGAAFGGGRFVSHAKEQTEHKALAIETHLLCLNTFAVHFSLTDSQS